jgi:prepilin-type N-terminal cleavage/methylation domain-containing protein
MSQKRIRAAFTLVELLVVIGIIALLISILLPAISRAREQSNRTQCLVNLRSLGQAMVLYANQYRDRLPNTNPPSTPSDYAGTNYVLIALNRDFVRAPSVFHCPSDSDPVQTSIDTGDYVPENSARTSYDFYSVWWAPEKGPKLARIRQAPLAWDLNVNPLQLGAAGQNHGASGGNVLIADGSVAWQRAKEWDNSNWPAPANKYYR